MEQEQRQEQTLERKMALRDEDVARVKGVLSNADFPHADVVLRTLWRRNNDRKEWLREKFGLDETGRRSITIERRIEDIPEVEGFVKLFEYIGYRREDLQYMWDGRNKVKITKLIDRHWRYISDLYYGHDSRRSWVFEIMSYADNAYFGDDNVKAGVQIRFGELSKDITNLYLSTNLYDFFTMSGSGCNFTSCLRIGGEYFSGAIEYMVSPNVMVAYTTDGGPTGKKTGRIVVYHSEDLIIPSRKYGDLMDSEKNTLVAFMKEVCGGEWCRQGSVGSFVNSADSYGYVDNGYGDSHVRLIRDDYGNYVNRDIRDIKVHDGICLLCGDYLDRSEGLCRDCYSGSSCDSDYDTEDDDG